MRDHLNRANALTSGRLVCGFIALLLAATGEFGWAAGLVAAAATLDTVGGMAARRMGTRSHGFGDTLDSLADLVSFGVAPALCLYLSVLHELLLPGIAVSLAFLLCGAWRLARLPLVESPRHFVGLPILPAGILAALAAALSLPLVLALAMTMLLTVLMVSEVPFPKLFTQSASDDSRRVKKTVG